MQKLSLVTIAVALAAFATAGSASQSAASASTIVNINARTEAGATLSLAAGTYQISWAGIAGGGLYDAWQYNTAASGNFRDTFTLTLGSGAATTYDTNAGQSSYSQYATASAALQAFQSAGGANALKIYSGNSTSTGPAPLTFTVSAPTVAKFTLPDLHGYFGDNAGGVSLSVTAVPEPGTYALMIAGLGAMGLLARRRAAR